MAQKRANQQKKPKSTSQGIKKRSKAKKDSKKSTKYQQNLLLQNLDDYTTTQSVLRIAHNSNSNVDQVSNSIETLSMNKKQ
ncbi:hypothetical protein SPOG_00496 [Schizosaccharomyces cryophilus OY26]|uniref:Uncharacterized protein n=1 Tax=Schizosaccharomyces cryophilus (strain OY26 / ATCC MYA-4695 / CBS 11777 / NBRC 106824 / NRRL Y48691) TaxID=653667 RepID=S9XE72_SCHCR|nr:uncharacterized protein SPOG_00496 [Schizosaccharomyces cryophilus OY26]EPY52076.1 hypothetical protein SPOG_00496 [Schizosaccharomyces cryophilus OY26]